MINFGASSSKLHTKRPEEVFAENQKFPAKMMIPIMFLDSEWKIETFGKNSLAGLSCQEEPFAQKKFWRKFCFLFISGFWVKSLLTFGKKVSACSIKKVFRFPEQPLARCYLFFFKKMKR